jgi:hypothetical protein
MSNVLKLRTNEIMNAISLAYSVGIHCECTHIYVCCMFERKNKEKWEKEEKQSCDKIFFLPSENRGKLYYPYYDFTNECWLNVNCLAKYQKSMRIYIIKLHIA